MFAAILRFLKQLFNYKVKIEPISEVFKVQPEKIELGRSVFKVALIVGHTKFHSGANSYNGYDEWSYNKRVAEIVKMLIDEDGIPIKVKIFHRPILEENYRSAMKVIAKSVSIFKADFSLELHFNSIGHERNAYGCEILINHDANNFDKSVKMADYWTDKLAEHYNLKERGRYEYKDNTFGDGVKVLNVGERGYWNMAYLNDYNIPVSLLIEPTFAGTKTKESEQFFEAGKYREYAVFLRDRIKESYENKNK